MKCIKSENSLKIFENFQSCKGILTIFKIDYFLKLLVNIDFFLKLIIIYVCIDAWVHLYIDWTILAFLYFFLVQPLLDLF
jgi:hypothetical protein